ncbi:MAG: glycosyltransferase family 1 protein [Patescibacteria group bacterium]
MSMKIVIDARFFGTETGIGRYVKELIENLEKIDSVNNYVVFLRKENFNLYQPKKDNFEKKLADIKWYSLAEQFSFRKMVDAEKANLAHFPNFNVPVFCRTPYVVTIHDLILRHFPTSAASTKNPVIFYLKYFLYNFVLRRAVRDSKKIIAPTYFVKNDILKNFRINPDKIRVISEGLSNLPPVDLGEEFLKTKNIAKPYILYVGNCYPHKNLEKLIEAFNFLKNPELKLVLVGKRDYFSKNLELRVTNYELKKNIIFYGYASDSELSTLYKHAALYAFPSLMEGFGLPPLEAMSFNLPVACSDIPALHEVLGESVFYFNPKSAKDMADTLALVLSGAKPKKEGALILSRYSWRKNASETNEIYTKFN